MRNKHLVFLEIAQTLSKLGTCIRRKVGAIGVDKYDNIIASGYNGSGKGLSHCIDNPCKGANLPSKKGLSICQAIHAEMNTLIKCDNMYNIEKLYVTCSPCIDCAKVISNTNIKYIYYGEVYDIDAVNYLIDIGIVCQNLK